MKLYLIIIICLLVGANQSYAQYADSAITFHIYSTNTAFPDTGRSKGHIYERSF